jgi:hypothetical protein
VFWLLTIVRFKPWSTFIFFLLYWMPTPLEFGAFMCLPLYFAQVLHREEWKTYWGLINFFYIMIVFGLFLFQTIWIAIAALEAVGVVYTKF